MLVIDGKPLNCIECGNLGKRGGCEVCYRKKSKIRIKLEAEAAERSYWMNLTRDERIAIKSKERALAIAIAEAEKIQDRIDGLQEFARSIWEGLRKFRMVTTGHSVLDAKLVKLFGPW